MISGVGSPEKAQATVRTFPSSMLTSDGRASILGELPLRKKRIYKFQIKLFMMYEILIIK